MHHVPCFRYDRNGGVGRLSACSLSTISSSRPGMIAVGHLRRRYAIVSVAADGSMKAESSATAHNWLGRISMARILFFDSVGHARALTSGSRALLPSR
jgi:hypothetical protein